MGIAISNLALANYQHNSASLYGVREEDESAIGKPGKEIPEPAEELNEEKASDKVELSEESKKKKEVDPVRREKNLTDAELRELKKLRATDREVKAHEQAHRSVGGEFAMGPVHYVYKKGPDGKMYAVGGDVSIDASKVSGDPEETIRKMQTIKRAALAPADPSPQDRRAAMIATRIEASARQSLNKKVQQEKQSEEAEKARNDKKDAHFKVDPDKIPNLPETPYDAVAQLRNRVQPELVSNLFDLYT